MDILAKVGSVPEQIPGDGSWKPRRDRPYEPGHKVLLIGLTRVISVHEAVWWYKDHGAGQVHAEALIRQGGELPLEWRRYVILFPGTEWGKDGSDPITLTPYMFYGGQSYNLGMAHDIHRCHDHYRIALLHKG